jgi:GDP-L-fucose synthase
MDRRHASFFTSKTPQRVCCSPPNGELPVNLGTGEEMSIKALAEMIAVEVNYTGRFVWDTTKPNGQPRRCLDVTRAKQLFGFEATHRLRDGIPKTVAWFMDHQDSLRQVVYS